VNIEGLRLSLEKVALAQLAVLLAIYAASFAIVEVLGFGWIWRRHLEPSMPWAHVRSLVLGKQVLAAVMPLLTKVLAPVYFWRRWRLSAARSVGASELVSFADSLVVLSLVSMGWLVGRDAVGSALGWCVAVVWFVLVFTALWVRSPLLLNVLPRLRATRFFQTFRVVQPRELASQLVLRASHHLVALALLGWLAQLLEVRLSPSQVLAFAPLFLFTGSLPVSFAGFGGPQGVAVALLVQAWGATSPDRALALSLVWSSLTLVTQLLLGSVHLPRAVALLREPPVGAATG
jgi:hypothetical protein